MLQLHTRGGKASQLLGQHHQSQHVAALSLARAKSFKVEQGNKVNLPTLTRVLKEPDKG